MNQPLVSIIVVSHNHGDYIEESMDSALSQDYPNVELIVVDDNSSDHTVEKIERLEQQGARFKKLIFTEPIGYCRSFNRGFSITRGQYIIDLAADDVLMPTRASEGVKALQSGSAGVDFCDAYYIDGHSRISGTHYRRNSSGELMDRIAEGNIFCDILERYFICTPTMLIDRRVLEKLKGYDESLYYEDFDFWVRSSRHFDYHFTNKLLVKKRVLRNSMSKSQYLPQSKMLDSTLQVCQKALDLCRTEQERESLGVRLKYEMRQAVISNNYGVARGLYSLLENIKSSQFELRIWSWLISQSWDFSILAHLIGKAR